MSSPLIVKVTAIPAIIFILFTAYTIFIWLPVNIYNESVCLSKGYPEHRTSVGLNRYCVTIDGVVQIKVDKQ